jgi:hypothetical protein
MAESTELCARCHVNPRNSSNPSYCKDCYRLYARESRERHKNKLCETCDASPKAKGSSYCDECRRLCSRCHVEPRTSGCYCQACQRLNEAESKERRKDDPCTRCGEAPRMDGSSYCHECRKAMRREDYRRRFPDAVDRSIPACDRLCARCGVNPRNSCHPSYCVDCYKAVRLENSHRDEPCACCRVNPRDSYDSYCADCRRIKNKESQERFRNKVQTAPCACCYIAPRHEYSSYCQDCLREKSKEHRERWAANAIIPEAKLCPRCEIVKPADEFDRSSGTSTGLAAYCRPCVYDYNRTNKRDIWQGKPLEQRAALSRKWMLKSKYGLTPEEYDRMLEAQDGKCAICGSSDSGRKCCSMPVDHNHVDGSLRQLLCWTCNTGLGLFGEDIDLLASAIDYLGRPDLRLVLEASTTSVALPWPSNELEQKYLNNRWSRIKYRYGITPVGYTALLANQENKCAICASPGNGHKYHPLHIDHDADTGAIRGLLCLHCNVGVGMFAHNTERLQTAIDYLIKHDSPGLATCTVPKLSIRM